MSSIPKPLFPAYQKSVTNSQKPAEDDKKSRLEDLEDSTNLSRKEPIVSSIYSLPIVNCSSYRPELIEEAKKKDQESKVILVSSSSGSDSDLDSDDCVLVYENKNSSDFEDTKKRQRKHHHRKRSERNVRSRSRSPNYSKSSKKKKKSNSKHKKHKKSRDKDVSSRSSPKESSTTTYDNDYLNYLPRGRANFLEDIPNLKQEDAYRIDRRPDGNNRAFDSLQHVPKYWFKEVIDFTRERDQNLINTKKKAKIRRYFSHKSSKLQNTSQTSSLFVFANESLSTNIVEYIPVVEDAFHCSNEEESQQDSQGTSIRFRSMIDDEKQDEVANIGPKRFPNRTQLLHELKTEFNRAIQESKDSIVSRWIDFICFQDLIALSSSADLQLSFNDQIKEESLYKSSNSQLRFYIEKKLAICQKALDRHCRSTELNLLRIQLISDNFSELGMESAEVDQEWKRLAFLFPTKSQIWSEWIRFSLRSKSITTFKAIRRTRKIFRQSFASFSGKFLEGSIEGVRNEEDGGGGGQEQIERILIDLAQLLAQFLKSIDQPEKAVALFQALVEFNLFTPSDQSDLERCSFDDWYHLFEQFWDSGVSRLGEFPSSSLLIGWNNFHSMIHHNSSSKEISQNQIPEKDSRNLETFNHDSLLDQCENLILEQHSKSNNSQIWLEFEQLRARLHWLPANAGYPTDKSMEDLEDLERLVLSDDDLKPFLFRLRSLDSKFYLIENFLQYLQINLITFDLESAPSTSKFEYELPMCDKNYFGNYFHPNSEMKRLLGCSELNVGQFCRSGQSIVEELVFDKLNLIFNSCVDSVSLKIVDSSKLAFIDNLFEKLVNYFDNNRSSGDLYRKLVMIWIQHKLRLFRAGSIKTKAMRTFIKDFLRLERFRNSLDLWYSYCLFEFELSPDIGRKYYCNTILLMLNSNANGSHSSAESKLLQFTLGFVRAELELDSVLDHFVRHCSGRMLTTIGSQCSNFESNFHLRKRIALKVLLATVCPSADGGQWLNNANWWQKTPTSDWEVTSVEIIRANRKLLEQNCQDPAIIHSQALLIYLSKGLAEFCDWFESMVLEEVNQDPTLLRSHYLLYIELLVRHLHSDTTGAQLGPSKLLTSRLRSAVIRALDHFPGDSLWLSILVTIETKHRFGSMFGLRRRFATYQTSTTDFELYLQQRYLHNSNDESGANFSCDEPAWISKQSIETFSNIFFATLYAELVMLEKITTNGIDLSAFDVNSGLLNRIRHLFERALNYYGDPDATQQQQSTTLNNLANFLRFYGKSLEQCPMIWRLFLRFEIGCQNRSKAKAIIYRALQNCPNEKQLYLDGIGHFPELLQEFVDIMLDKELRLRTTIEEIELFRQAAAAASGDRVEPEASTSS